MAKLRSIFDVRGTVLGITIVNSKKYGKHVRAARGTRSKAVVNNAFKQAAGNLQVAMVPAKMIKNVIWLYRGYFTGGQFWQKLLSLFCRQQMENKAFDLTCLQNVEIHEVFPLERLWKLQTQISISTENRTLEVLLTSGAHPVFPAARHVDSYSVQVIAIFPSPTLESASHIAESSPMIPLRSKISDLVFQLPLPAEVDTFVICVKLEGMAKNTVLLGHSSKGMRIVKVGKI